MGHWDVAPRSMPVMVSNVGNGNLTLSDQMATGNLSASSTSTVWPAANRAIYTPVIFPHDGSIDEVLFRVNTTTTGDYDIGLLNASGARIANKGTTALPGAGQVEIWDPTDIEVKAGLIYYLGLVASVGATLVIRGASTVTAAMLLAAGVKQEALGSTAIPSQATFTNPASAYVPVMNCFMLPGFAA